MCKRHIYHVFNLSNWNKTSHSCSRSTL